MSKLKRNPGKEVLEKEIERVLSIHPGRDNTKGQVLFSEVENTGSARALFREGKIKNG